MTWQFLTESGAVVAAGLVIGIAGGIATGRALRHQLYGVNAFDPAALIAMSGLLAGMCLLATWLPSRRACQKDPAVSLRDG